MRGFHIDMNNAQFTREYLTVWLRRLSAIGYDTILWEVEDNIAWETCPECVSPDAFSKNEFREILDECRALGLTSIPLLQTLGHCEYVLKHPKYSHLAELQGRVDQYCPSNEYVAPLLIQWINEYLDLFGDVEYFHIGGDEAWTLGHCDKCSSFVEEHSLSQLYLRHMDRFISHLRNRNVRPIIWADMFLCHPEMLPELSRDVVLFDWMYETYHGCGRVWDWTQRGFRTPADFDATFNKQFERYLFPEHVEARRHPYIFYASDYLADLGFDVVVCPSSSCYGDSVFLPRLDHHLKNCSAFIEKGTEDNMAGWMLTSWTCHLFPWHLQEACIYLADNENDVEADRYRDFYANTTFGVQNSDAFWNGADAFSKVGLFMQTQYLGIAKNPRNVPRDLIIRQLDEIESAGQLGCEIGRTIDLIDGYRVGLALLQQFASRITTGKDVMSWWLLGARNQLNRAEITLYLLQDRNNASSGDGSVLLETLQELRHTTEVHYRPMIKPSRRSQMIHWMFDSCEYALTSAITHHRSECVASHEPAQ